MDGPQVGDLNLWQAENLQERFYSGKTRALRYASLDGRSTLIGVPLRQLATITTDTLDWYGSTNLEPVCMMSSVLAVIPTLRFY